MKYFTLEELCYSDEAIKLGIDNTPSEEQKQHIIDFVETLLDDLREDWSKYCRDNDIKGKHSIIITSGVRTKKLNDAVGGSKTSAHNYGYAVDMVPANKKLKDFQEFCIKWLKSKEFDQFISEEENHLDIPKWIHLGWKRGNGDQRRQFLFSRDKKYYVIPKRRLQIP